MLKERNKELALLMLRNLINDVAEDRVIVMDVEMVTENPQNDPYSAVSHIPLEQIVRLRTRINEAKYRGIAEEANKAMALAATKHQCRSSWDGKKILTLENRKGDFFQFNCTCGGVVEISGKELAAL